MKALKEFMPLFSAILAFCAFMGSLGFIFNLLLSPVKEIQAKIEQRIDKLETGQMEIKQMIFELKNQPNKQANK